MSDEEDTFSDVPVVGHHVEAEIEEPEDGLADALNHAAEELDITRRDLRYVKITEYDVSWDEPRTMTLPVGTFERLCAWFLQTDSPDEYLGPDPEDAYEINSDADGLFDADHGEIPDSSSYDVITGEVWFQIDAVRAADCEGIGNND
ncbi:hypothetical protein EXE44_04825 [Halorubrum sp. SS7]|uniref:hypothetical protein n=1 Tax=unclassified Halorubrum TaxID=2642239 RepID=UPI0010F75E02|nr:MULTISPECIES: hypothetical protein [unclassified Halorubrum]TKX52815.1 hypothetical protein EXE42_15310 [Halorubrum sp. SP3]TKX58870.1 hypothetical protein EXE44_04825 [Halorubrum sp. SS7]TKX64496.1 hypothetical protein EXE45_16500 [Halorubrum sp. SP9]